MAKGVRVRQGDVFCVKLDEKTKGYLQFLFSDKTQLGGNVIRVFYKHYPIDAEPTIEEIVSGEVAFYTHTYLTYGIWNDTIVKIGGVKGVTDIKLPGVIFGYPVTITASYGIFPPEETPKEVWYLFEANEPIKIYESVPRKWVKTLEDGGVKTCDNVIKRMKYGFFVSSILDEAYQKRPRPDADIYVQIPDKNGKPKTMINFHGEKAVRQIYFKRTGVVRVSEDRPCVGLRLLRRRKFSSSFWEYDNFIEKDEFERTWNEA